MLSFRHRFPVVRCWHQLQIFGDLFAHLEDRSCRTMQMRLAQFNDTSAEIWNLSLQQFTEIDAECLQLGFFNRHLLHMYDYTVNLVGQRRYCYWITFLIPCRCFVVKGFQHHIYQRCVLHQFDKNFRCLGFVRQIQIVVFGKHDDWRLVASLVHDCDGKILSSLIESDVSL